MNKFFFSLTFLIVFIIATIYGILFTKFGNNFIASYIENKVNDDQEDVKLKVNDFTLTFNTINFDATINDDSKINISGVLDILKRKLDIKYDLDITELSTLENLTNQKLNGPLSASGTFVGDESFSQIKGISNIAQSETSYDLKLVSFEAKNINFLIKNAKIENFLHLLNQKNIAKGTITIKGDIKDANIASLDGNVSINILNGKLNNEVMNREFKQNIASSVYFRSDISAVLTPNTASVKSDLITSLLDVFVNNTEINLSNGNIVSDYKLDLKSLSKLEGIIGTKLNGSFLTNGNLTMKNNEIEVNGDSNIFESLTSYSVKLLDNKAEYIKLNINNAKIDKLLHVLNQPIYADGILNINADVTNGNIESLDGTIETQILKGRIINPVANTVFKQNLKQEITFKVDANTALIPNQAITQSKITTTLANLNIKKAVFDFKDSSLNSDYLLEIPKLENLYDITSTKMRGAIDINGDLLSKNNSLLLTGKSELLDGNLDFSLKNNDFHADLKDVQIKKLTHMLYYPDIFDSKTALSLDYDLLIKKGKLKASLLKGHFIENDFSKLLNQFAKFDITREIYDTVDINSNINKLVLTSTVDMKSKNTEINIDNSILNLEKSTIDAKINTKIKDTSFALKVVGQTASPKISLDSKDLVKDQLNNQVEKNEEKIKENLNKVLKGKLGEDGAQKVLEGFKSLF